VATGGRSLRNAVRWGLLLLALALAAYDAPQTWQNYSQWRRALPADPSAAEFWRTAFYMDVTEIGVVLGVAIALWLILWPRAKRASAEK